MEDTILPFRPKPHFYNHRPLNPGQIRLLRLEKWKPSCGVRASLEHVYSETAEPYMAISYTWGSTDRTHEIHIDGIRFKTTRATYEALYGCSSVFESCILWIDYVCIDQNNAEEKNEQVAMMREIYENANLVVAWLDGSSTTATHSISFINMLSRHTNNLVGTDIYDDVEQLCLTAECTSFVELLSHPWFTRIWVVQEVAVASNFQLLYSGLPIDLEIFKAATALFVESEMAALLQFNMQAYNAQINLHRFRDMEKLHTTTSMYKKARQFGVGEWIAEFLTLPHLLTRFIKFDSTDPRDKVFAILGLASDLPEIPFQPDYTKPVNEVFIDTARYLILGKDPFSTLSLAGTGYGRNIEGLPSWVQDWTNDPRCAPLSSPAYCDEYNGRAHHAGGKIKSKITCQKDSKVVRLEAIIVDKIVHLSSLCHARIDDNYFYTDSIGQEIHAGGAIAICAWHDEALGMVIKGASLRYDTKDKLIDAFWRTLCRNRTPKICPAPALMFDDYKQWVAVQEYFRNYIQNEERGNLPADQEFWTWVRGTTFGRAMGCCISERKICVTKGGYIGAVPPGSRVGDTVGIFVGAPTPYILREQGGVFTSYELVGDAYVHDMMDGQMMSKYAPKTIMLI